MGNSGRDDVGFVLPRKGTLLASTGRRRWGEAQPGWKAGPFTIRLPFLHYEIEFPELIQGLIMTATSLGGVALLEDLFGIPYEVAVTVIVFQHIGYFLHQFLGDTTISGWLTPAVPLIMSFVGAYAAGPERIQAYIALQLVVGVVFVVLGTTGLARRLISAVPRSLKAGLIVGAGLGALLGPYGISPDGRMFRDYRTCLMVGVPLTLVLLFSERLKGFAGVRPRHFLSRLTRFGMVPGLLVVALIAVLSGEAPLPQVKLGFLSLEVGKMLNLCSVSGLGWPKTDMFLAALPLALVAYIMAFGETVLAAETAADVQKTRPDELIGFESNRLNIITGIRNLLHGLFAPTGGLSGPNWAAMTMSVARRYENGPEAMYSFIGGAATFNLVRIFAMFFLPVVTILTPFREPVLCILMILQGFACLSLGFSLVAQRVEYADAVLIGVVLFYYGAAAALVAGFVLYFSVENEKSPLKGLFMARPAERNR